MSYLPDELEKWLPVSGESLLAIDLSGVTMHVSDLDPQYGAIVGAAPSPSEYPPSTRLWGGPVTIFEGEYSAEAYAPPADEFGTLDPDRQHAGVHSWGTEGDETIALLKVRRTLTFSEQFLNGTSGTFTFPQGSRFSAWWSGTNRVHFAQLTGYLNGDGYVTLMLSLLVRVEVPLATPFAFTSVLAAEIPEVFSRFWTNTRSCRETPT